MNKLFILSIVLVAFTACGNPIRPSDDDVCLSPETEQIFSRLSGVRAGDPDYDLAVTWSSICPKWGLLK